MISGSAKLLDSELSALFKQCKVWFERLDSIRKWLLLTVIFAVLFIGWRTVLQNTLSAGLGRSRDRILELSTEETVIKQRIGYFTRLKTEGKLVSVGEYRHQMSGRTTIGTGLGQWGEQCGLFLNFNKQDGDEVTLNFMGSYPATMKFFERLANEADGLVAFRDFRYQVSDSRASGGFADIELRVVLRR